MSAPGYSITLSWAHGVSHEAEIWLPDIQHVHYSSAGDADFLTDNFFPLRLGG